jgi:hypothetical protein
MMFLSATPFSFVALLLSSMILANRINTTQLDSYEMIEPWNYYQFIDLNLKHKKIKAVFDEYFYGTFIVLTFKGSTIRGL